MRKTSDALRPLGTVGGPAGAATAGATGPRRRYSHIIETREAVVPSGEVGVKSLQISNAHIQESVHGQLTKIVFCTILGNFNGNVALGRLLKIGERRSFEIRREAFNVVNRFRWDGANNSITSASFGRVTTQGNTPRRMQIGMKLFF